VRADTSRRTRRAETVAAARRRDGNRCQAITRPTGTRCFGELQPHEIIPRSQWRDGIFDLENVVMLCAGHHRWAHEHPAAAHNAGLRRWSWERNDE
jgi:hypothetical protein